MKRPSIFSIHTTYSPLLACLVLCVFLLGSVRVIAQQSVLVDCNKYVPLVTAPTTTSATPSNFASLSVTSSTHVNLALQTVDDFSSKNSLIDADLTNYSEWGFTAAVNASAFIETKDLLATGSNIYPAGTYAGFLFESNATTIGSAVITTYNSTTLADTYTVNYADLNLGGGLEKVGFVTTKPFDRVRITFSGVTGVTQHIRVYYSVFKKYCLNNTDLACNANTTLNESVYPIALNPTNTGIDFGPLGVCAGCAVTNPEYAIDGDPSTAATIASLISVSATASIGVKNQLQTYPANTFVGFDVQTNTLLAADLFGSVTIRLYSNGSLVQTSSTGNLLLNVTSVLGGATRQIVGLVSTATFDEAKISFFKTGADLGTTSVFGTVVKRFCTGPDVACNTNTILDQTVYPVAVDPANTGTTGGLCVICGVSNATNAIDGDASSFASISLTAGLGASASLAIKNQLTSYPANTFAGFDIENSSLVGVNLLTGITIQTLLNGVVSQSANVSNGLVSLNSSILSGAGRQTIGFLATLPFNGIKITLNNAPSVINPAVTLNLGSTKVYSAIIKEFCAGPTIVCSTSAVTPLTNTAFPVYINSNRTGTGSSLACVGCAISNAENVINSSTSSPATISLGAAVSATARLSVANPIDTYPAESYVGFDIESSTLVGASLLGRTRITLYNNGSAVQTGSGASLLAGVSLVSGNRQTVGTVAQVPFDEVEIEFTQLVSANPLGTVSIYRAVIQKACVTQVSCNQTKFLNTTDFSAFIEGTRTGLFGGVSADLLGSGVANPGNAISPSTTDFARITNVLGVGVTASISVADPADVYPAGTFAGYTISKANLPVSVNLFSNLTVNTYLNGVLQESSATAGNLIDLSVFLQIFGGIPSSDLSNVGFITSKPFDEIQLSVSTFTSVANFVDVYGAFIDTRTSSNGGSLVCNFVLNPDFNVTTNNVPVSGDVSTNDKVPTGTTYGTPVASGSNPSGATIVLATTGAYSFTATTPGTYTYTVAVCATGQTSCPTTPLIITVLDQSVTTNKPVANPDYASVQSSTAAAGSITINVKANDGAGNPGGVLGTPAITINPTHGTAIVDGSGNVTYTPATGYIGDDVLTYQVCETPGGLCATAQVTVHVVAPGSSTVTVADDYISTTQNAPVTGNVLTNDQGTGLTVSNAGTITSPGKGTLVITSTGSYTFTPATGVTGPVDFTYTACDGGTLVSCGTATLHILVKTVPDLVIITTTQPSTHYGTTNFTVVEEVYEINSSASTGLITVYVAKDPLFVLSFDGSATLVGGKTVNNSVWTFDASNANYYKLTTNAGIVGGTKRTYGLTGILTPGNTRGSTAISSLIGPGSGSELNIGNNSDSDTIDYFNK